jgi:hypothetical protein
MLVSYPGFDKYGGHNRNLPLYWDADAVSKLRRIFDGHLPSRRRYFAEHLKRRVVECKGAGKETY